MLNNMRMVRYEPYQENPCITKKNKKNKTKNKNKNELNNVATQLQNLIVHVMY